jgi:O-antigen ligase
MAIAGAVTAALIALVPNVAPVYAGVLVNISGKTEDLVRAVGTFGNPNFLGGSAAMSLTAAASLMASAQSRRVRVALLGCAIVLGGAVIISLSRGALIAALVGLLAVGLTRGRRTAIAVVAVGLVGALIIYPAFVEWRLASLFGPASAAAIQQTGASDANRVTGALAGVSMFLSSPLVGVGFGHYLANAVQIPGVVATAHNWYTYVLGEQGIVGAILFVSALAALIPRLWILSSRPRSLGVSVLAAFATACLFLEVPTSFQTFAMPAIVLAAAFAAEWPSQRAARTRVGQPALVPMATPGGHA